MFTVAATIDGTTTIASMESVVVGDESSRPYSDAVALCGEGVEGIHQVISSPETYKDIGRNEVKAPAVLITVHRQRRVKGELPISVIKDLVKTDLDSGSDASYTFIYRTDHITITDESGNIVCSIGDM